MPRISLPTFLWLCFTVFIVYATTIPFNIVRSYFELGHNIQIISWTPFYDTSSHCYFSRSNIITNILFFIPFGVFGFYSLQNRSKWTLGRCFFSIWFLGVIVSAFVEFLQMFTIDRNTSTTDLITNSAGALIGALCAYKVKMSVIQGFYIKHLARLVRAKAFFPFVCIVFLTLVASTAPFDFFLSRGRIFDELGHIGSTFKLGIFDIRELFNAVYFFSLFSAMVTLCFFEWKLRYFRALAFCLSLLFGIFIITCQLFIGSRHLSIGMCYGFVAGSFAGIILQEIIRHKKGRWVIGSLLLAVIFSLIRINLSEKIANVSTLGNLFSQTSTTDGALASLANFIQITCLFLPIGFLLSYLDFPLRKMYRVMISLLTVPALAFLTFLLFAHGVSFKHFVSVIILAESGVLLGAVLCVWGGKILAHYAKEIEGNIHNKDKSTNV